jgi:hypothetical protein
MVGPIEAEAPAKRAARRQIEERSRDIASRYINGEGAMNQEQEPPSVAIYMADLKR